MAFDTSFFKAQILKKIFNVKRTASLDFQANKKKVGTRFTAIDNLLDPESAQKIQRAFYPDSSAWREMNSFREKKLTTKQYNQLDSILGEITFAFQDAEVVKAFEDITGIQNQVGDPGLYAGGLSMMRAGDFLDPHIDNSHDQDRLHYRRLNLLYYVTPDWKLEDGGHLELWNEKVTEKVTIESQFNRLVLMETHHLSWHSVSPVKKSGGLRKCVSNYYFSKESPLGYDYFHITAFSARPEQPLKRVVCQVDNFVRSTIRKLKPSGLGKKDLYLGR